MEGKYSRRKFVASAMSASAISVLPGAQRLLGEFTGAFGAREQKQVSLTTTPAWRDQGIGRRFDAAASRCRIRGISRPQQLVFLA